MAKTLKELHSKILELDERFSVLSGRISATAQAIMRLEQESTR